MKALQESIFSPGTEVEVNLNTENTILTWFPAIALGEVGTSSMLVRLYKKSSNNGEKELLDKVTVHLQRIRPQPPEILSDNKNYELLEKVDSFSDSGWSVGIITKILSERRYVVTFNQEKMLKEFNHSEVRPHLDWIDGQWVTHSGVLFYLVIYCLLFLLFFFCCFKKWAGDGIKGKFCFVAHDLYLYLLVLNLWKWA